MTELAVEPHRLACTADGVFIWPGMPLVEKRGRSFSRVPERDIANRAGVLFGPDVLYGPLIPTLERAARFLERGQIAAAQETITKLNLPPLTAFGQELTRIAPGFFDADKHPRWPAGSPDSTGGEFRPADSDDNVPTNLPSIIPVTDYSGGFHQAVVDAWMEALRQKGFSAVAELPIESIGTVGQIITGRPDIIVNAPGLPWTAIEIKTGDNPTFTGPQASYYPLLQIGGHILSWDPRVRSLGWTPGVPFPPMPVLIVYAPGPGQPYAHIWLPAPEFAKALGWVLPFTQALFDRSFDVG